MHTIVEAKKTLPENNSSSIYSTAANSKMNLLFLNPKKIKKAR